METPGESASVNRGAHAVLDTEERARWRTRVEGKRGQIHDTQDVLEPQAKTKARLEPRNTHNPSPIWRKRSRRQFQS